MVSREERRAQTRSRLASSALTLFECHGYAEVTLAQVAAHAGVAERTLYRYAADKEELLFLADEDFRTVFGAALQAVGRDRAPLQALQDATLIVATQLDDGVDDLRSRAALVASSVPLRSRERAKHDEWMQAMVRGLVDRGTDPPDAHLLARVGVACWVEAVDRFVDHPAQTLREHLVRTFGDLERTVTIEDRTGG